MGDISYRSAGNNGRMKIVGHQPLIRDVKRRLTSSVFAGIPPALDIA